jgi:hypothetical protein
MLLETIRHYLAIWVYAGFASEGELIKRAVSDWEVSWEEDDRPLEELIWFIKRTTSELLGQHQQEQLLWPDVTDCDRLNAAFAEIDRLGILSRQNFEQTMTSGCAAIEAEARQERAHREIVGYVFYHEQDTESAVSLGGGPWLAWGAFSDEDEATRRVAQTIVETLRRHGIEATWCGEPNNRIGITGMRWKRRRDAMRIGNDEVYGASGKRLDTDDLP